MTSEKQQYDPHFMQLVLSLQAAAMQQMGKVMNPMTSKVERDLLMAQNTIDMLTMIDSKTKNNLTEDESKLIEHVLYELRLNYVDETNKKTETEKKVETTPKNAETEEKVETTPKDAETEDKVETTPKNAENNDNTENKEN